ncbi:MAG: 50S ribosomal protein L13 [Candidatus Diapherotrites archaeon]|nr:50S ribosomal protein L13 [Candidatus Diapherotrites archaeon]
MMIVNVKGLIAGRVATKIAKAIINGEKVIVLKAQDLIITGNKDNIIEKFKVRVNAAVKSNPNYGPKYSRIPSRMFRKMVRSMLPTKQNTKDTMIKSLMVYNETPAEFAHEKAITYEEFKFNERNNAMTLKEIAEQLGGKW